MTGKFYCYQYLVETYRDGSITQNDTKLYNTLCSYQLFATYFRNWPSCWVYKGSSQKYTLPEWPLESTMVHFIHFYTFYTFWYNGIFYTIYFAFCTMNIKNAHNIFTNYHTPKCFDTIMFILRELIISTLPSYASISNAAVGNTICN